MIDTWSIKEVVLDRVHGHQSSRIQFQPGLNIIYGKNGTGKTTLLHVLVNLLERDIERFLRINFKSISVTTYDDTVVRLDQKTVNDKRTVSLTINGETMENFSEDMKYSPEVDARLQEIFSRRPIFLPAYRNVLEGTRARRVYRGFESEPSDVELNRIMQKERQILDQSKSPQRASYAYREQIEVTALKTMLCREWFGDFVPTIRYPSINDVHRQLEEEIEMARYVVAAEDEKNISSVFKNVLEVVLSKKPVSVEENVDALLQHVRQYIMDLAPEAQGAPNVYAEIASLLKEDYSDIKASDMIKGILKVYTDALSSRSTAKERAYAAIEKFVNSVNNFLDTKPLRYDFEYKKMARRAARKSFILLPDGRKAAFNVLSSGERHILSLIFAATHMSPIDGIVVIDEPELSLHVDWQRIILGEIQKQAGERQIIACTHSPEVAADHMDKYIELHNDPNVVSTDADDDSAQLEIDIQDK